MTRRAPWTRHLLVRCGALCGALASGWSVGPGTRAAAAASPPAVAFECTFTEPFASLWIGGGRVHGAGPDLAPTSSSITTVTVAPGGRRVSVGFGGFTKATTADRLELTRGTAADGMSSRRWGWSVRWRRSGATLVGACDRLDDGAVPRQVSGVAADDVLHVRATASAKAASLASVPPGATVWRRPGATAGTGGAWHPVEIVTVKPDDTTAVVRGWANGRYLTPLR